MIRLPALIAPLFLLAACAARPPHPETFTFGVLGDTPYDAREELLVDDVLADMAREPLAFAVHVGDFKSGGNSPCTDTLFEQRRAQLDRSRHPLVYTPGDNDWTDCRRKSNGPFDPLERLAKLRALFFADGWSLGRARMPLARQEGCAQRSGVDCTCPGLPENRLWKRAGTVFMTVHVVASNDNRGFDAANDAEQACRAAANRAWLEQAVRFAEDPAARGLVILTHADPWEKSRDDVYGPLLAQVAAACRRLAKPVLFVHGDTHVYRVDRPFRDGLGATVDNVVRLETFGSPDAAWVRVTVDPNDKALFRIEPRHVPGAPGG